MDLSQAHNSSLTRRVRLRRSFAGRNATRSSIPSICLSCAASTRARRASSCRLGRACAARPRRMPLRPSRASRALSSSPSVRRAFSTQVLDKAVDEAKRSAGRLRVDRASGLLALDLRDAGARARGRRSGGVRGLASGAPTSQDPKATYQARSPKFRTRPPTDRRQSCARQARPVIGATRDSAASSSALAPARRTKPRSLGVRQPGNGGKKTAIV